MEFSKEQHRRARKLRNRLVKTAEGYKKEGIKRVAVPLSGGVDSHCALFACMEAGLTPHVYSVHLEGVESRDVITAERTAKHFGLKFTKVTLPSSYTTLLRDIKALAKFGCKSKTDFECFWIMWYLLPAIKKNKHKILFTGHGADSLYCLSRKANQHFRHNPDEFRKDAFASSTVFQKALIDKWCDNHGIIYCPIFFNNHVLKIFLGAKYEDLNKPIQKAVSRLAFYEYFEQIRVYVHQPAQLGDSGIKVHFLQLLDSELNPNGKFKSVTGVYNRAVKKYGREEEGLFN